MKKVAPIDTLYDGNYFRSRLEARWAIYANELNVPYIYEPNVYSISKNETYLPDFYFPTMKMYGEVKWGWDDPTILDSWGRYEKFVLGVGKPLLLLVGLPSARVTKKIVPRCQFSDEEPGVTLTVPFWDCLDEQTKYMHTKHFNGIEDLLEGYGRIGDDTFNDEFNEAILFAQKYRFYQPA